jgi:hypothetical protein
VISKEELAEIRTALERAPSIERIYQVDLVDAAGTVHAAVEKTVYIRKKLAAMRKEG